MLRQNLEELKKLLEEKYLKVNIKDICTSSNDQIEVTLKNNIQVIGSAYASSVFEDAYPGNKNVIEYLKTFDANVSKEKKGSYMYQNYSIIKFDQSKLKDVIDGLKN